jgi:nitric oxide reductase NorD protein
MEEQVGELWHKLITRVADNQYPASAVFLHDIQKAIGIYFRALGGDGGLQIETADATENRSRRSLLQRIAGSHSKVQFAWRDERSLKLPQSIAWFDSAELNTDLYYWLACLAAVQQTDIENNRTTLARQQNWFVENQTMTLAAFNKFPGIKSRYLRLLEAHLQQRPDIDRLPANEAEVELAIQHALTRPGEIDTLPAGRLPPQPVPLWLHPEPPFTASSSAHDDDDETQANSTQSRELDDMGHRQAERVKDPEADRGLITVRMENIFSMGEFVNVDRGSEDEEDPDRAEDVARDLDKLSVASNGQASKTRLKFDLDLPSAASDDVILDDGILLPEWDWKKQQLLPARCRIVQMQAEDALDCPLPPHLAQTAKRLRNQFQAMAPARVWHRAKMEGQDIDLDAYIKYTSDRAAGQQIAADNLYREIRSGNRDLACLLLADLSLSTDAHINDEHRVIDVIRDSLYLFAESLHATGDRFSMLGFSSRKRDPIRIHNIKRFNEPYNANIRGRIEAIKPGYYTRLGAAIRYASQLLATEGNGRRLLLIISDGKPNDLDQYEGRYGIEDTRQAVISAKSLGLLPFCITIDKKANDYLPHLFGKSNYAVIRHPEKLPQALPKLYSQLTH